MPKATTYPGRRVVAETVADRLALIRQAIGTIAKPISLEALGELVGFDKHKMSRIASESQEMKKSDAEALASVDPLKRGPAWLMFGDEGDQGGEGDQGAVAGPPKPRIPIITRPKPPNLPMAGGGKVGTKKSGKGRRGDRSALAS